MQQAFALVDRINEKQAKSKGELVQLVVHGEKRTVLVYPAEDKSAPVYFDIHGGGFSWGSVRDGELINRQINEELGMVVCSLDYPRTPQCQWPSQQEYLYETICHIVENAEKFGFDPNKIILGGRSAGANLAAVLCIMVEKRKSFSVACQILDHPCLDLYGKIPKTQRYYGKGALSHGLMEMLADAYAERAERKDPLCSPVAATDALLAKLPPAIIQTCELDSLRPDGDEYARMLQDAGVLVKYRCAEGAFHGFTQEASEIGSQGRNWIVSQLNSIMKERG